MVAATGGGELERAASFDVFLSHSVADKPAVARLAGGLRARGLRPWLDAEQVQPGVRFQEELAAGLAACRSFAVFVGGEIVGGWVAEELDAALSRSVGDRSFRVFLVLLPGAPEPFDATGLHRFLSQRTWVDLRRVDDAEMAGDLLARAVRGEPLGLVDHEVGVGDRSVCPYVGLRAFEAEEAAWFFGRDADTQRMAEKLRATPFLAVLGRSGVGKSSAVRAGLVPALAAGRVIGGSERWVVRVLRPTSRPLEVLAGHVSELRPDMAASRILECLAASDVELKLLTAGRDEREPVLWVVDQAEELLTLCQDPGQRRAFVANLLHASQDGGPGRVVVALRSDFYPRFAQLRAFSARMAQNQHVVTALDDDQLGQVMTQPAALVGLSLEPGLVRRITDDVHAQAGALPLLQHALRELWERRRGSLLTHDAYDEIGGVQGAVAHHADAALARLDQTGDGSVARRLMVELVRLGEGVEDTKQPVRLADLVAPAYPLGRLHRVASTLADARLVTTDTTTPDANSTRRPQVPGRGDDTGVADQTTVELAHEALIRSWPRLRSWLEESRDDLRIRRRIRDAALAWHDQGCPDDLLYRGTVLALAREHIDSRQAEMHEVETEFLTVSAAREDMQRAQARQRRTRVFTALSALTALTLVAAVIASVLFVEARNAEQDAQDNAARALAQQARALAPDRPALALAVAAEAHQRLHTTESADALQAVHLAYGRTSGHLEHVLTGHPGGVNAVAFGPNGTLVATAGYDGTAKLWDPLTGDEVATLSGHTEPLQAVVFNPDGTLVATASLDGSAKLWDPTTGDEARTLAGHDNEVSGVAFSPTGDLVATASWDGTAKLWDPSTGDEVATLSGHTGAVFGVVFSPDGSLVATASDDGTAKVWDPTTGDEIVTVAGVRLEGDWKVAFSPDSTLLAVPSDEGAKVWDPTTGDEVASLTGGTGTASELAFSPDGTLLAVAGYAGTAAVWDPDDGDEIATLADDTDDAMSQMAFSPDGTLVATSAGDGTAKLWDPLTGDDVATLSGHTGVLADVAFSPDGTLLSTAGEDGTARLWDPTTGGEITSLADPGGAMYAAAFSPDGSLLATGSFDATTRLWDPAIGAEVATLTLGTGHSDVMRGVAFSPDGSLLATGSDEGTVVLWDPTTGAEVATLTDPTGIVDAVAFSADGSLLATGGYDGRVTLWDPTTREVVTTLIGSDIVAGLAFSPDDNLVATVGDEGMATLWDPDRGEVVTTLSGHPGVVYGVAFSPDGTLLATASEDGTAKLWDPTTGDEAHTLQGHTGPVTAVAFSPDGTLLATTSDDGTAKLWDPATGEVITTLYGNPAPVNAVAFSPDGSLLATTSLDGTALIRHLVLAPSDACALVSSEVTRHELVTALGGDSPQACTNLD